MFLYELSTQTIMEKPIEEKSKAETSPCCNAKAVLSARFMGKEAWRCMKCKKLNSYKIILTQTNNA